jgi:hypothetical protein
MLSQYHQQIVIRLKDKAEHGLSMTDAITQLRQIGLTIMDSIKILMAVYGISLREAKNVVADHPAWHSVIVASQPLHEELIANLKELLIPATGEDFSGTCEITRHEVYTYTGNT